MNTFLLLFSSFTVECGSPVEPSAEVQTSLTAFVTSAGFHLSYNQMAVMRTLPLATNIGTFGFSHFPLVFLSDGKSQYLSK